MKWKCSDSNLCDLCQCVDDIEHYFYECGSVQLFWKYFFNWWCKTMSVNIKLSITDILFGIQNPNNLPLLDALNFCILFAKMFIYNQRKCDKELLFYSFQVELKNRLELEHCISMQQNSIVKLCTQWEEIYENL